MKQESDSNLVKTEDTPRDYLFDNIKAILILLVVWGHLLSSMLDQSSVIKSIYVFIYFFHMPGMVFISGYFSKKLEKVRNHAFTAFFIPYLILNIIFYFYKIFILQEPYYVFRVFNPSWGLWYLLVLFFWRFFLKDLVRIRFVLPISFLLAVFSGYSREFSSYMDLGRTVSLLPFFLLGYYCTGEHVKKIRRMQKKISAGIITGVAFLSRFIVANDLIQVEVLYLRSPYPKEAEAETMIARIIVYVVAIAMCIAIINLVSAKRNLLSSIGTGTMSVYIFHLFTIPILEKFRILKKYPYQYLLYSILMTFVIVFIYTRPSARKAYNYFMDKVSGLMMKNMENNKRNIKIQL